MFMHSKRDGQRRCSAAVALIFSSILTNVACEDDAGPPPSVMMGSSTGDGASGSGTQGSGGSPGDPDDDGAGGRSGGSMLGTGETGPDIGNVADGSGGSSGASGAAGGEADPACAGDMDGDGSNDCEDGCPSDGLKLRQGACGCGVPDTDSDGDGAPDCEDACATDFAKTEAGACGCGRADVDSDGDGPLDCDDECPHDATRVEAGDCGCGAADNLALCLRHRYSFDEAGETAIDSVGDADGVIVNTAATGDGTLVLAGTDTDEHVDLPDGIISALGDSATFEVWLAWTGAGGPWQRIFDFGSSEQPAGFQGGGVTYLFVTPSNTINLHLRAAFTNAAPPEERVVNAETALPFRVATHVALVIDGAANTMVMYLDGEAVGEPGPLVNTRLSNLNDINNWIGRSQFIADEELQATLEEFRIYSAARSAEQILADIAAGPDALPAQ